MKQLPLEMIEQIMHFLPLKYSQAISQGLSGASALDPYQFHEPDEGTQDLIKSVISRGKRSVLDRLLKNPKIQLDGSFALETAVQAGCAKSVARLLQDPRVDPSANDSYAIQEAAFQGHGKIVKILLQDQRVDPSADDSYAFRWAARHGHAQIARMLLQDQRVDPSAMRNYALIWSAREGDGEIFAMLLQDPRVDLSVEIFERIFSIARFEKHWHIVELLEEHQARHVRLH